VRDKWRARNDEMTKIGGGSITPTGVAIGTVAVLATFAVVGGGVWWLGHKKGWWGKSLNLIEEYKSHELREEDLKDENLSIYRLCDIVSELRPENIALEQNKKLRREMEKQASLLLYPQLQARLHELSHLAWDQIKNDLPANVANKIDEEWQKNLIFITVPPPGLSEKVSVEEVKALEEAMAMQKNIENTSNVLIDKNDDNVIRSNVNTWSFNATTIFDVTTNKINAEVTRRHCREIMTLALVKTIAESTLTEKNLNTMLDRNKSHPEEDTKMVFTENEEKTAREAKEAKTTLPQNLQDMLKKYTSTKVLATRLKTLRNLGYNWDNKEIRQDRKNRMLATSEIVALNAIMATINERALNNIMIETMFNIKGLHVPDDIWVEVFC
jgi:hypothetical protein